MKFWKFQANGNDFVLAYEPQTSDSAVQLCDRRRGIGADGVLAVQVNDDCMQYHHYNADGSSADLCVNGIRCAAQWYFTEYGKTKVCVVIAEHRYILQKVGESVSIVLPLPVILAANKYRVGVEHCIVDELPTEKSLQCNYDTVEYQAANKAYVETLERGVGKTLSCGSGMIASYYHGYIGGHLLAEGIAESLGGTAQITIKEEHIVFSSPVHIVFTGIYFEN